MTRRTLGAMNPDGAAELLAAILTGAPSLPGAACRRRAGLFDDRHPGESAEQQRHRFEAAAAVCARCPAQPACRSAVSTSRHSGVGVQGGRVLARE